MGIEFTTADGNFQVRSNRRWWSFARFDVYVLSHTSPEFVCCANGLTSVEEAKEWIEQMGERIQGLERDLADMQKWEPGPITPEDLGVPIESSPSQARELPGLAEARAQYMELTQDPASAPVLKFLASMGKTGRQLMAEKIAADPEAFHDEFTAWIQAGAPTCSHQAKQAGL
ncbi:Uncharacterised protein [Mycobacteroides abscessus subsp. massiliense]|uniref:hypothetical protein n=1 Tax=Mycobacteroides abscessus TaxID=36809 RepID=UPI0009A8CE1F|nr:hypothetical protein [Mycobacteroides abscessus]MBE5502580.1 hypothetical protein [Mycobacteroides abscessus]SLH52539.1 Uncharacterised protein [Mycobacteroides abscessus subsp. massiliense]